MTSTRRAFLRSLLAAPVVVGSLDAQEKKLPVTGEAVASLACFDEMMTRFVEEQKIPGASLALAKDGKLVYARGFGYADPDKKSPVEPGSLFRLASVSKTFTGTAIVKLAEQGKLGLDDKVLDHVRLDPVGKLDARWSKITIRHLLQHTAGWNPEKSGDVTGRPGDVAAAFRVAPPVGAVQMVRYALGRPLDFDPGSKFVYANVGYLILGRVIEAVTKGAYDAYVRKELLAPLGLSQPQLGREMPERRAAGEVRYFDRKKQRGPCLYPPRRGQAVPIMDGAFNFEAHDSFGGWIASAVDLVAFAGCFQDPEKCPLLKAGSVETLFARPAGAAGMDGDQPSPTYYGCGWSVRPGSGGQRSSAWHEGMMPGSSAMVSRLGVGVTWAVLFNTDLTPQGQPLSLAVQPAFFQAGQKVTAWPEKDLFPMYINR